MEGFERFLEMLNLVYYVDYSTMGINNKGIPWCCIKVSVYQDKKPQYLQHHCYEKNGKFAIYSEGNQEMGVNEGKLKIWGDDRDVDNYFEKLARTLAKEHFHDINEE
jgi:hypothetical protein